MGANGKMRRLSVSAVRLLRRPAESCLRRLASGPATKFHLLLRFHPCESMQADIMKNDRGAEGVDLLKAAKLAEKVRLPVYLIAIEYVTHPLDNPRKQERPRGNDQRPWLSTGRPVRALSPIRCSTKVEAPLRSVVPCLLSSPRFPLLAIAAMGAS